MLSPNKCSVCGEYTYDTLFSVPVHFYRNVKGVLEASPVGKRICLKCKCIIDLCPIEAQYVCKHCGSGVCGPHLNTRSRTYESPLRDCCYYCDMIVCWVCHGSLAKKRCANEKCIHKYLCLSCAYGNDHYGHYCVDCKPHAGISLPAERNCDCKWCTTKKQFANEQVRPLRGLVLGDIVDSVLLDFVYATMEYVES